MKHVMKYGKPYVAIIVVVLLMKIAGAVLDLMIPSALADILDVAVPTAKASGDTGIIIHYGLKMAAFAFAELVLNTVANFTVANIASKMVGTLRQDLFDKVTFLSARQLDDVTIPSAVSRLTSDTYNVQHMINRVLRMGVRAPMLMIGGIVVTAMEDPMLALLLVFALPAVSYIVVHLTKKAVPLNKEKQSILDRMVRTVQENASGIRVIKALSKTEYEKDRYDKVNNELAEKSLEAGLITTKTRPLVNIVFYLSLVGVIVVGAFRVNGGHMLPGKIVAFMSYFTIIINATQGISGIFVMCSNGAASAGRIQEVMAMEKTMETVDVPAEESPYAVEFRDVRFSYNGIEDNLTGVSFGLKKGQTLGIIGATGSGKSTLVNLLLRFYDADGGQIFLDGQDIRSIDNEKLRKKFGVVFQNDFVVADTIAKNIDFYRDLDEDALRKAAVLAQAAEFIAEKEGGMEYQLAVKGNNLSGGQKQRLLIARALAANPEVLVLDDSSSALDYRTDAGLRRALAEHFAETTKIIVAQRVSSIKSADCILVLEGGEVIGKGTHDELMVSCEEYRHIANTQMEAQGKEVTAHG